MLLRFPLVLISLLTFAALWSYPSAVEVPNPNVQARVFDPYASEPLLDYGRFRDAFFEDDLVTLRELADTHPGYLAYRAALTLARHPKLTPEARLPWYRRTLELAVDEPLARLERRALHLEIARTAEAAGHRQDALDAYREALPEREAVQALRRLEANPYRLANALFQARLHRAALDALGNLTAPSIEAPAYRALGDHERALDAYERWLDEQPANLDARYGEAWSHFYLGNLDTAEALFGALAGPGALYGRALIANRAGDTDTAVALLRRTGEPARLWLATGLLEAKGRYHDVLPVYLELAAGGSGYADDAAYRALVLARRLGDDAAAARALALIPGGSFFSVKLGSRPVVPSEATLPTLRPDALTLAAALARVNDHEAAVGELLFALREARDEATVVALAEGLQAFGEFRQSQRAAQRFVDAGSREGRTWRLAYPRAYPEVVLREAAIHRVEPELIWAVMRQESAFYPRAVSTSNARGLMQVIPSTWNWLAELQREPPGDPFDPADNIRYGTFYLRWLHDYLGGDAELVITSYNRGQGYIKRLFEGPVVGRDKDELYREIDALETREYLQRVAVNYEIYKAIYGGALDTAEGASTGAEGASTGAEAAQPDR